MVTLQMICFFEMSFAFILKSCVKIENIPNIMIVIIFRWHDNLICMEIFPIVICYYYENAFILTDKYQVFIFISRIPFE